MTILEIVKLIRKVQNNNPYPADIWSDPMGRNIWDACCKKSIEEVTTAYKNTTK